MKKTKLLVILIFSSLFSFSHTNNDCIDVVNSAIINVGEGKYNKALEELDVARENAYLNKDTSCLFLILNNIGNTYYYLLDYGEALSAYLEAYEIAINTSDIKMEMTILNNISVTLLEDEKEDKAFLYLKKAYKLAKDSGIKKRIGLYAINIGAYFNSKKQWKEAIPYFEIAKKELADYPELHSRVLVGYGNSLMNIGKIDETREILMSIVNDSEFVLDEAGISAYHLLSTIELKDKNYNKAITYAKKAISAKGFDKEKKILYAHMAEIYTQKQDYINALIFKDSVSVLQERINDVKMTKLFEANKVKFSLLNYKTKNDEQVQKIRNQRKLLIIIVSSALLVIFLLFWGLYYRKIKFEQQKIINRNTQSMLAMKLKHEISEQKILEQTLKEKESQSLLEKEKLLREIEHKNRELTAKALYLYERNELIKKILLSIEKESIENGSSLSNTVQELKSIIKSSDEWSNFIKHFEEINPEFIYKLNQRHPNLNNNDIRFITYVYMNLSSKEISSIFNITLDAYRKRKERITKKLELSNDNNLFAYLLSL